MDFVIPVALGEILAEMSILTAAELNRHKTMVDLAQDALAWIAGRYLKVSELMYFVGLKV